MTNHTRRMTSRRGGWNLIELLVVISIITILLAILINSAAEGKGPEQQTKVTMRAAIALQTEYEVKTSVVVDHMSPATLPGPPAIATPSSMSRFLYQLWGLDHTRNALYSLGRDALEGGTTGSPGVPAVAPTYLKDGWGKYMRYYGGKGGQVAIEGGTVMTLAAAGMPAFNGPYLASAGPDGVWGTFNATTNVPNTDGAVDNLFSNDLK